MFAGGGNQPRYRSARSVQPRNRGLDKNSKTTYLIIAIVILLLVTLTPVIFLEKHMMESGDLPDLQEHHDSAHDEAEGGGGGVSLNNLMHFSKDLLKDRKHAKNEFKLARGVSGMSIDHTPALVGAERGEIQCDVSVDSKRLAYWNSPQGKRDQDFVSPFKDPEATEEYFLTFEPDPGGWNNIRMSFENLAIIAAATGRTLVLPPIHTMYTLGKGEDFPNGFWDLFPTDNPELQKHLKIITMKEFIETHAPKLIPNYSRHVDAAKATAETCVHDPSNAPNNCRKLYTLLEDNGFQPNFDTFKSCFIFDEAMVKGKEVSDDKHLKIDRFCGTNRKPFFYNERLMKMKWIHWDASNKKNHHRLLNHFYTFMYFTDPIVDNFYKRFVRDFLHYKDDVFCAAWKIIKALDDEAKRAKKYWSALHVRRGDLQYKKVKISAEEWYKNTQEVWKPKEIMYIATDEKDKSFFDTFTDDYGHPVKFIDDFWDIAGLEKLDQSQIGLVEAIVASHGRAFAGTWFSTFTGYINRLRGYVGHSMKDSWYGYAERKEVMRDWTYPEGNYPAREWPIGWVGIDSDEVIEHEGKVRTPHVAHQKPKITKKDLEPDEGFAEKPVARGVAGLPLDKTPAVKDAKRGSIQCDINVDSLAYWNDPQGSHDIDHFKSPFAADGKDKYITFSSDRGGWNNVRMEFEIVAVLAAALGRTLVLPPKEIHYLLHADKKNMYRGVTDFYNLDSELLKKRLKIMSFKEFIEKEGGPNGRLPIPEHLIEGVLAASERCDNERNSTKTCLPIWQYLKEVGHLPNVRSRDACVVFDHDFYNDIEISDALEEKVLDITGFRKQAYFDKVSQEPTLIHFRGRDREFRLRAHFYGFIVFTDPKVDNYMKRLVRDLLHYNDEIYCAAGKIVKALQAEGKKRGHDPDSEGAGGYSAMHIRTGKDFPHQKVQLPADEWYQNTFEIWDPDEILYIATDEKNKTKFNDIAAHHDVRFIEDYWELAGLDKLDPNYVGMVDAIVASRARAFAGTWFSTFSGFITRMRGYHGMTMKDTWYSWLDRKTAMHKWVTPTIFQYGNEWPDAWIGIDGDEPPKKDEF